MGLFILAKDAHFDFNKTNITSMNNIFSPEVTQEVVNRIQQLTPESTPLWGKMTVAQMLAHLCVSYEKVYDANAVKAGLLKLFLLKTFVKNAVVSEKPYKKNSPTAPEFKIVDEREFEAEKNRLIQYIQKTQQLGKEYFHNREYPSFGVLTGDEWNNLFYKHIDHHLTQFGV